MTLVHVYPQAVVLAYTIWGGGGGGKKKLGKHAFVHQA